MDTKQHLLNKKVMLLEYNSKKVIATGTLYFLGKNENLNWKLQATINRTPFEINSYDQIVEYDENKIRLF